MCMQIYGISSNLNKTKTMFNLVNGFLVGLTFYKFRVLKDMLREVALIFSHGI